MELIAGLKNSGGKLGIRSLRLFGRRWLVVLLFGAVEAVVGRAGGLSEITDVPRSRSAIEGSAPLVVSVPQQPIVTVGSSFTLSVSATGTGPLSYQWRRGETPLVGQTGATFQKSGVILEDGGDYNVLVSNEYGSVVAGGYRVVVRKLNQTIAFTVVNDRFFSTAPIPLQATASSGLPVTFRVRAGPGTVNGATLSVQAPGGFIIDFIQEGNDTYNSASAMNVFDVKSTFAWWRTSVFSSEALADEQTSSASADPDNDGIPNLLEYALGTSAWNSMDATAPTVSATAEDWTYTYRRPADRYDLVYAIEASTDLQTWSAAGVVHEYVAFSNGFQTFRARYPVASAANVYFRMKVTLP